MADTLAVGNGKASLTVGASALIVLGKSTLETLEYNIARESTKTRIFLQMRISRRKEIWVIAVVFGLGH
jgi:hypothetical protein